MRGEYSKKQSLTAIRQGTPPFTRGIRLAQLAHTRGDRNTPACAGNIRYDTLSYPVS